MRWTRMKFGLTSGWLALGGLACNSQPASNAPEEHPVETPNADQPDVRPRAPKPDPSRLSFDENTQVLQLYDLPEQGAYWMVTLPTEPRGVPVQGDFKFSKRADPKTVQVSYTLPQGGMSNTVSLQEIVDAKKPVVH